MPTTVKTGWLKDKNGDKFAPKTLTSQIQTSDGILLEDKIQADLDEVKRDNASAFANYYTKEEIDNMEFITTEDIDSICGGSTEGDGSGSSGGGTGGGANIDVVAEVGQTIRVKEVDENGKPTAWESAEYLEPLIGTTEEITPTQVMEALTSGRAICITHTTNNFGQLKSNIFTFYPSYNMVCCSGIIVYGSTFLGCELAGFLNDDSWQVCYAPLTTSSDIQYDS